MELKSTIYWTYCEERHDSQTKWPSMGLLTEKRTTTPDTGKTWGIFALPC